MAWVEIHQSLPRHRKVLKTAGRLAVDRWSVVGHLVELWCWALDNADIDGKLGDLTETDIELAAQWNGEPGKFAAALIEAGLIDEDAATGQLILHDWYDYAGRLVEARLKERERSKERRQKNQGSTGGRPPDNRRTDRGSTVGTVPYRTLPNTEEEERPPTSDEPDDKTMNNLAFSVYGASLTVGKEIDEYIAITSRTVVAEALRDTLANARTPAKAQYFRKIMTQWIPQHPKTISDVERIRAAFRPASKPTQPVREERASDSLRRMRERGEL